MRRRLRVRRHRRLTQHSLPGGSLGLTWAGLAPADRKVSPTETLKKKRELAMHKIIQENIDRFKLLLKTETEPTKRAMMIRVLAEEEAKQVPKLEKKEA